MKKKVTSLRWILLAAGIIAVVGLTAMNVYSLYTLRSSTMEAKQQSRQIQVAEFADRIRSRFFNPFYGFGSVAMQRVENVFNRRRQFPDKATKILFEASSDSIFKNIYYIPVNSRACRTGGNLLQFNAGLKKFQPTSHYSAVVCDGMGIARTRMKALIKDYRYNNKVLFDTHRSMFIALVNQERQTVIGYLAMPINREFMVEQYLQPKMVSTFGTKGSTKLDVWLRNWTNGQIIAKSNPGAAYSYNKIDIVQQFPDFFNDWRLYAYVSPGSAAASENSLWVNMFLLGTAFIFLIGAMLFMFYSAQQERALANRQSDFLANVTHELKTPITVMQAAGENLADGRIDDQERLKAYGSHIYSEALRLRRMIDQLLDVAKAGAGESLIHPEPIAINKSVTTFLEEHRSYFNDNGFTLHTRIPAAMPKVMIDEDSLNTILSNLVNNAMKYSTDDKFLGIYLSREGADLILQVEDHGVGMSNKSIKHIFEKFYRSEDPLTAETKGYGLGLAIVKNLVDLNGGTISVDSEENEGSTFTISFPIVDGSTNAENQAGDTLSSQSFATSTNNSTDYV